MESFYLTCCLRELVVASLTLNWNYYFESWKRESESELKFNGRQYLKK